MNNFEELNKYISTRRSIRNFRDQEIPDEVFLKIIESASMATNGCKAEPWFFYVVKDKAKIKSMQDAIVATHPKTDFVKKMKTFFNAPYIISVCIDMDTRWYHSAVNPELGREVEALDNPDYFSVAAAIENLLLAAHACGIGTCWLSATAAYRSKLEKILGIKHPHRIAANIAIGHYDEIPPTPRRKPIEDIYKFI